MTNRCGGYWSLFLQRDRIAAQLIIARAQNGKDSQEAAELTESLADAIARQNEHLASCPVCSRWNEETKTLAECAPVGQEEGEE